MLYFCLKLQLINCANFFEKLNRYPIIHKKLIDLN